MVSMRTLLALLACSAAFGQEFEVASIKAATPPGGGVRGQVVFIGGPRGGPGTADPTHITWSATLAQVLMTAYNVKNYQINGPDWLTSDRFDFAVVVPEGATKEQVAIMWRNLLKSRFGMTLHTIQKEFPADELVVGPNGHKLKQNTEPLPEPAADIPLPPPPPGGGAVGQPGPPALNQPGMLMMMRSGPTGIVANASGRAQTMAELAQMLSNQLGHPVVDKTGLSGRYDFSIEFAPTDLPRGIRLSGGPAVPGPAPAGPAPPTEEFGLDLAGAIQQQLGLRLVRGKGMLDVVVVDKAERLPTDN